MPNDAWKIRQGVIPGLRLPQYAWSVLDRDNITTIDQLKAIAGDIERLIPGAGPKTAEAIRAELARVTASEDAPPRGGLARENGLR
ncbi:MAG TPA: hypothetical protein VEZ16_04100 [Microvirga sp.]|nr:hypothetical protein [Microvirga sp.]